VTIRIGTPIRSSIVVGLVSAAVIAYELLLMQAFSIAQWSHFAYLVISIALLGFGAAGSFLALMKGLAIFRSNRFVLLCIFLVAVSMAWSLSISQLPAVRFDTYLLLIDHSQVWHIITTVFVLILPFFFSAMIIVIAFQRYPGSFSELYFASMTGSGLGGILLLALSWWFLPHRISGLIAILPVFGLIVAEGSRGLKRVLCAVGLSAVFLAIICPARIEMSEFKAMNYAQDLPDASLLSERNSPFGLVQTLSSSYLRYAPGMSLKHGDVLPLKYVIYNNGEWAGSVSPVGVKAVSDVMNHLVEALPYIMVSRNRILLLNPGSLAEIIFAREKGVGEIDAVFDNPIISRLYEREMGEGVCFYPKDPRAFLEQNRLEYDLITLPIINSFGGSSEVYSMRPDYLMTIEAISEAWDSLAVNGVLSVSCWIDYPFRAPLKLLATITEVLEAAGVKEPRTHIAAVRGWSTICFIMKKGQVTAVESERIRDFCSQRLFDPLLLPDIRQDEQERYNYLQDRSLFDYIDRVLAKERGDFYSEYDFYIRPARDMSPFFPRFFQLTSIPRLTEIMGGYTVQCLGLGYLVVLITFVVVSALAVLLILTPLLSERLRHGGSISLCLFFLCLGGGYILVEIVLIQYFILYLGSPVYSASGVISFMLICSGLGSIASGRFREKRLSLVISLISVVVLLYLYTFLLNPVLRLTISSPLPVKWLVCLFILGPLFFVMGIPFPVGLSTLTGGDKARIAWAWGVNGSSSVACTAMAMIIAVEVGMGWVLLVSASVYLVALLSCRR